MVVHFIAPEEPEEVRSVTVTFRPEAFKRLRRKRFPRQNTGIDAIDTVLKEYGCIAIQPALAKNHLKEIDARRLPEDVRKLRNKVERTFHLTLENAAPFSVLYEKLVGEHIEQIQRIARRFPADLAKFARPMPNA